MRGGLGVTVGAGLKRSNCGAVPSRPGWPGAKTPPLPQGRAGQACERSKTPPSAPHPAIRPRRCVPAARTVNVHTAATDVARARPGGRPCACMAALQQEPERGPRARGSSRRWGVVFVRGSAAPPAGAGRQTARDDGKNNSTVPQKQRPETGLSRPHTTSPPSRGTPPARRRPAGPLRAPTATHRAQSRWRRRPRRTRAAGRPPRGRRSACPHPAACGGCLVGWWLVEERGAGAACRSATTPRDRCPLTPPSSRPSRQQP